MFADYHFMMDFVKKVELIATCVIAVDTHASWNNNEEQKLILSTIMYIPAIKFESEASYCILHQAPRLGN